MNTLGAPSSVGSARLFASAALGILIVCFLFLLPIGTAEAHCPPGWFLDSGECVEPYNPSKTVGRCDGQCMYCLHPDCLRCAMEHACYDKIAPPAVKKLKPMGKKNPCGTGWYKAADGQCYPRLN